MLNFDQALEDAVINLATHLVPTALSIAQKRRPIFLSMTPPQSVTPNAKTNCQGACRKNTQWKLHEWYFRYRTRSRKWHRVEAEIRNRSGEKIYWVTIAHKNKRSLFQVYWGVSWSDINDWSSWLPPLPKVRDPPSTRRSSPTTRMFRLALNLNHTVCHTFCTSPFLFANLLYLSDCCCQFDATRASLGSVFLIDDFKTTTRMLAFAFQLSFEFKPSCIIGWLCQFGFLCSWMSVI